MLSVKYSWILGISIIIISACSKSESRDDEIPALIPFKTGNKWTYESTIYGIQHKSANLSTTEVGEYVEINGNKGFRIAGSCGSFIVRNDENGNVVDVGGYSGNNTLFAPCIRYKKNAIKGEKWNFNIFTEDCSYHDDYTPGLFVRYSAVMTCIKVDTLIQTAKGQFKCKAFSYSPDGGSAVYIDFVSDGVGRVKTEYYEDDRFVSHSELVDYMLK